MIVMATDDAEAAAEARARPGRPATHGPRRNVTMALPIEFIAQVDQLAEQEGITRTEFILRWVEMHPDYARLANEERA